MSEQENDGAVAQLKEALAGPDVSLAIVQTFTHGRAVQVKVKTRKVGPLLVPNQGETVADVLRLLATMTEDKQ